MNLFADSSALAKQYVPEAGSDRFRELLWASDSLGLSAICSPEVISALSRRRREGSISEAEYRLAKEALHTDVTQASVVGLADVVLSKTTELLERWPLRAADALHVASASIWGADLFVSSDRRQCAAAKEYGLTVEELPR